MQSRTLWNGPYIGRSSRRAAAIGLPDWGGIWSNLATLPIWQTCTAALHSHHDRRRWTVFLKPSGRRAAAEAGRRTAGCADALRVWVTGMGAWKREVMSVVHAVVHLLRSIRKVHTKKNDSPIYGPFHNNRDCFWSKSHTISVSFLFYISLHFIHFFIKDCSERLFFLRLG